MGVLTASQEMVERDGEVHCKRTYILSTMLEFRHLLTLLQSPLYLLEWPYLYCKSVANNTTSLNTHISYKPLSVQKYSWCQRKYHHLQKSTITLTLNWPCTTHLSVRNTSDLPLSLEYRVHCLRCLQCEPHPNTTSNTTPTIVDM